MKLKKSFIAILIFALACCIFLAACAGFGIMPKDAPANESSDNQAKVISNDSEDLIFATVSKVVDGDTVWVKYADHPDGIKLRYIGIDCPESVHDDESKNTKEGKVASDYNKELIESAGNIVYLQFDEEPYDQYGRLLAYVYIYDAEAGQYILIEDILLAKGYCRAVKFEPNIKYYDHFKELESAAKEQDAGFFGTGFYN